MSTCAFLLAACLLFTLALNACAPLATPITPTPTEAPTITPDAAATQSAAATRAAAETQVAAETRAVAATGDVQATQDAAPATPTPPEPTAEPTAQSLEAQYGYLAPVGETYIFQNDITTSEYRNTVKEAKIITKYTGETRTVEHFDSDLQQMVPVVELRGVFRDASGVLHAAWFTFGSNAYEVNSLDFIDFNYNGYETTWAEVGTPEFLLQYLKAGQKLINQWC